MENYNLKENVDSIKRNEENENINENIDEQIERSIRNTEKLDRTPKDNELADNNNDILPGISVPETNKII